MTYYVLHFLFYYIFLFLLDTYKLFNSSRACNNWFKKSDLRIYVFIYFYSFIYLFILHCTVTVGWDTYGFNDNCNHPFLFSYPVYLQTICKYLKNYLSPCSEIFITIAMNNDNFHFSFSEGHNNWSILLFLKTLQIFL